NRVLRRAGNSQDRARCARRPLPFLEADRGHCRKHSLSDEDLPVIITKKALPRRTFLKGAGTALALPLLDAMVPSLTALADTPADPGRLRRLGFVYIPMGCDISRWTPP